MEEILSRMKTFGEELDIVKGNTELLIERIDPLEEDVTMLKEDVHLLKQKNSAVAKGSLSR